MLRRPEVPQHLTTARDLMAFMQQWPLFDVIGPYELSFGWTMQSPPGTPEHLMKGGFSTQWTIQLGEEPWPNGEQAGALPPVATPMEALRQYFGQVRTMLLERP